MDTEILVFYLYGFAFFSQGLCIRLMNTHPQLVSALGSLRKGNELDHSLLIALAMIHTHTQKDGPGIRMNCVVWSLRHSVDPDWTISSLVASCRGIIAEGTRHYQLSTIFGERLISSSKQ